MGTQEALNQTGLTENQIRHLGSNAQLGVSATGNNSQANAYAIVASFTQVTDSGGLVDNSLRMPLAIGSAEDRYFIRNDSPDIIIIFPGVGDSFNDLADNASINLAVDVAMTLYKVSSTKWLTQTSAS